MLKLSPSLTAGRCSTTDVSPQPSLHLLFWLGSLCAVEAPGTSPVHHTMCDCEFEASLGYTPRCILRMARKLLREGFFSLGVDDSLEQAVPGLSSLLMCNLGSAVPSGFLCYPLYVQVGILEYMWEHSGRALPRPKPLDLLVETQLSGRALALDKHLSESRGDELAQCQLPHSSVPQICSARRGKPLEVGAARVCALALHVVWSSLKLLCWGL